MFKNVLISVSDKTGLVDFLQPFAKTGLRIVSTGGTADFLRKNNFNVVDVSEQTGFPEVMGGRVKTLHPNVHMCLLARENVSDDSRILEKFNLTPFDLVICNLYPFEKAFNQNVDLSELIEKIDIGGPSMLRAAAKNYSRNTVICDPEDYKWVQEKALSSELSEKDRKKLAARVFSHVSSYDSLVSKALCDDSWGTELTLSGRKIGELRYGENPQQKASWYMKLGDGHGLHSAEVLQGKPLSYNNILDLDAASMLCSALGNKHKATVAVKHNNPCGVALSENLSESVKLCLKADPISVFGGIVATNSKIDEESAIILKEIFLECIVATEFSDEALKVFSGKKNLRILRWPKMMQAQRDEEFKSVCGGFLIQNKDQFQSDSSLWQFIGEEPNDTIKKNLIFAEMVCSSLKSNAIAIVQDLQTRGLGMGQVNRVEAVKHAIERMNSNHGRCENAVLASDAFFPFADSIELIAQAGIKWILQPGGSLKDDEVIRMAKNLGVNLVMTGVRHFRH